MKKTKRKVISSAGMGDGEVFVLRIGGCGCFVEVAR